MSTTENFWDFSLRTYAVTGVAPACLALQNDCGLDVNVLLYCCWAGRSGVRLSSADMQRVLAFSTPWADRVVRPLRAVRTWMKTGSAALARAEAHTAHQLRESIKAAELESERLQQRVLETRTAATAVTPDSPEAMLAGMAENLQRYLASVPLVADATLAERLAKIMAAATGAVPSAAAHGYALQCFRVDD